MLPIISYVKIGIIVALVAGAAGAYAYVKKIEADNAKLKENAVKYEEAIDDQKKVIEQQEKDSIAIREALDEQVVVNQNLANNLKALEKRFFKINASGERRDIGALALAKTKMVEKIINRGAANAARCIEIATGAELTEAELNATKKSQINPECPAIANPNYVQY